MLLWLGENCYLTCLLKLKTGTVLYLSELMFIITSLCTRLGALKGHMKSYMRIVQSALTGKNYDGTSDTSTLSPKFGSLNC